MVTSEGMDIVTLNSLNRSLKDWGSYESSEACYFSLEPPMAKMTLSRGARSPVKINTRGVEAKLPCYPIGWRLKRQAE